MENLEPARQKRLRSRRFSPRSYRMGSVEFISYSEIVRGVDGGGYRKCIF